jgi:hypothetical protein
MTTTTFISPHVLASMPNKKTVSIFKHTEDSGSQQQSRSVGPSGGSESSWYDGLFQFSSSTDGSQS